MTGGADLRSIRSASGHRGGQTRVEGGLTPIAFVGHAQAALAAAGMRPRPLAALLSAVPPEPDGAAKADV